MFVAISSLVKKFNTKSLNLIFLLIIINKFFALFYNNLLIFSRGFTETFWDVLKKFHPSILSETFLTRPKKFQNKKRIKEIPKLILF